MDTRSSSKCLRHGQWPVRQQGCGCSRFWCWNQWLDAKLFPKKKSRYEDEDEDVEGVYVGSFAFFQESVNVRKEIVQQGTAIQIVEIGIPELQWLLQRLQQLSQLLQSSYNPPWWQFEDILQDGILTCIQDHSVKQYSNKKTDRWLLFRFSSSKSKRTKNH